MNWKYFFSPKQDSTRGGWLIVFCWSIWLLLLAPSLGYAQDGYLVHEVQYQETVYSLSRRYGVTPEQIYAANPSSREGIQIGQTLLIPKKGANSSAPQTSSSINTEGEIHEIAPGETLYSVARRYGLTEAELLEQNPILKGGNFPAGIRIRVSAPKPVGVSTTPNYGRAQAAQLVGDPVRVVLLLPVSKNGPSRYVEFYEGFLISVLSLKKIGISVQLDVFPANSTSEVNRLINSGKLRDAQLIIGGESEESVDRLANYARTNSMVLVSPFVWQAQKAFAHSGFFQINPPKQLLTDLVAAAFVQRYRGYHVLFVNYNNNPPASNTTYSVLQALCATKKMPYTVRSLKQLQEGMWPQVGNAPVMIVPSEGGQKEAETLFALLNTRGNQMITGVRFFGHPEWQSYDKEFQSQMSLYKSVIFTTFFFDENASESKEFQREYAHWFTGSLSDTYPNYSVLGYDVGRYFLRALAAYGTDISQNIAQLPQDGLQSNFVFRRLGKMKGHTNAGVFFVTYHPSGNISRESVVW